MFSSSQKHRILHPIVERRLPLPLLLSSVPAGFPSPAEDFADGALDLNDLIEHPAATFIVRVSGYSMTGAGIFDGDLLIVDRSIKPRSGQIVVAVMAGDMMVKRLRQKSGQWWLVPEAQDHEEFQAVEMGEDSEIWGVVKNVMRCLS
ncbi:MAG: translesion error-prone DNA polymerase V autoproteolytic subunit [Rhodospirillales bacterium]